MLLSNLPSSSGTVCRTARKIRLPILCKSLFVPIRHCDAGQWQCGRVEHWKLARLITSRKMVRFHPLQPCNSNFNPLQGCETPLPRLQSRHKCRNRITAIAVWLVLRFKPPGEGTHALRWTCVGASPAFCTRRKRLPITSRNIRKRNITSFLALGRNDSAPHPQKYVRFLYKCDMESEACGDTQPWRVYVQEMQAVRKNAASNYCTSHQTLWWIPWARSR